VGGDDVRAERGRAREDVVGREQVAGNGSGYSGDEGDDEPAAVAQWLPAAASAVGARPPRHVPRWLGRVLAGEAAAVMMTEVRGASNAKAKRELAWEPKHPSWRDGFTQVAA
jgi:nucleoside-diphosphate-sugar epimerase